MPLHTRLALLPARAAWLACGPTPAGSLAGERAQAPADRSSLRFRFDPGPQSPAG